MKALKSKQKIYLLLAVILGIAIFLRGFRILETFGFGHDADLFSWIVKDLLIDRHIRLIGQETSTPGIFIGPLFYYLLTPFYLITGFHPASAILLALVIGAITVFSYFFVFKQLFDVKTGLVAAFLQAVVPVRVAFDRWIVPTIIVNLWCIWYFYAIFKIYQGNLNFLVLAGFLSGLIWHVHIALAPLLVLIPLALIFAKKIPSVKQFFFSMTAFILPMLPFIVFELRHGFTQTASFYQSFFLVPENIEAIYGGGKLDDVIRQSLGENYFLNIAILIALILLPKFRVLNWKMVTIILVWVISVLGFFTVSKKLISEYYFENIRTIVLIIIIFYLSILIKAGNKFLKVLGYAILFSLFIYSVYLVVKLPIPGNGYVARTKVVEYIKHDSAQKQFPCISISHITNPGEDFGYRYLYWYNEIKLGKQNDNIPNYTIVFPFSYATESARFRYGAINVIPPEKDYDLAAVTAACPEIDYNLTDLFWGFTK